MDSQKVEVSNEQVEAVLHQSAALAAAFKRARRVRLVLLLALLIFVGGAVWVAYGKASEFTSEKNINHIADVAQDRLKEKQKQYFNQLTDLADKLRPPLEKAFTDQANKDAPLFLKAIEKERQPLSDYLEAELEKRINKRFKALEPRYLKLLKEEFPLFKDEKVKSGMVENITPAVERLLKKYYVEELRDELLGLFNAWDGFPAAQAPAKGEPLIEDQLMPILLDLLIYRLTHPQVLPFDE
jgi:hypothetical protein